MSDDEKIIKKRLINDGDGADRRYNLLWKDIFTWIRSKDKSIENNTITYNRIMAQLKQCESEVTQNDAIVEMIQKERKTYIETNQELVKTIKDTEQEIKECKEELEKAKNAEEANIKNDILVKVILQEPDRDETLAKIEAVNKEIEEMKQIERKLDVELEAYGGNFSKIWLCIDELKKSTAEDAEDLALCTKLSKELDISDTPDGIKEWLEKKKNQ